MSHFVSSRLAPFSFSPVLLLIILSVLVFADVPIVSGQQPSENKILSILVAENKPFPVFVDELVHVDAMDLAMPNEVNPNQANLRITILLWVRIQAAKAKIVQDHKKERIETIFALGKLRKWLLERPTYCSLVMANFIEHSVCMSALGAVREGVIKSVDGALILSYLGLSVTDQAILNAISPGIVSSVSIEKFKAARSKGESRSIIDLAEALSKELHQEESAAPDKLMKVHLPAALVTYTAISSLTRLLTENLLKHGSNGGKLNILGSALAEEIENKVPGLIGIKEPLSGFLTESGMYSGLIMNVDKWLMNN